MQPLSELAPWRHLELPLFVEVLQQAEESRRYWEARNRERLAKIAERPPKPGQEQIRAKLQAAKARLGIA